MRSAQYRDDELAGGYTWQQTSPLSWRDDIERSGVPMLVPVSWIDAGTAEGALLRFRHYSNPQNLVVMATSHGGRDNASPYVVSEEPLPPIPSQEELYEMRLAFFDHHLKGAANGVDAWPAIRFWNLGEGVFREEQSWPPPGTVTVLTLPERWCEADRRSADAAGGGRRVLGGSWCVDRSKQSLDGPSRDPDSCAR